MHGTVVVEPRQSAYPTRATRTALVVAGLVALAFVMVVAVPYLSLDRERLGVYWTRRGWLIVHILSGMVALGLGPVQFWIGLGRRRVRLHRMLGAIYVTSVAVGSIAAFGLVYSTAFGWVFGLGLAGLASAWILTTGLALAAVLRGLVLQHREWMIRSYVVTFAFVTFRAFWKILEAGNVGTTLEQLAAASWFCWAVPLFVTECILQGRKILAPRSLAASPQYDASLDADRIGGIPADC